VQETLARTVTRKKSGVMLWETDPLALLSKSGVGMAEATRTIPWSILALHLRSVCLPNDALHSLKCHPLTCKLLDSRLCADSTRTRFRQARFCWESLSVIAVGIVDPLRDNFRVADDSES